MYSAKDQYLTYVSNSSVALTPQVAMIAADEPATQAIRRNAKNFMVERSSCGSPTCAKAVETIYPQIVVGGPSTR